jgi:hypothetical protein
MIVQVVHLFTMHKISSIFVYFHSLWKLKVLHDKAFGKWVLLRFQWHKSSKDINKNILRNYFANLIRTLQDKFYSHWFMFLIYSYVIIQFGISLQILCFHSYFCICLVLGSTMFVCGILHLCNNFYFFWLQDYFLLYKVRQMLKENCVILPCLDIRS